MHTKWSNIVHIEHMAHTNAERVISGITFAYPRVALLPLVINHQQTRVCVVVARGREVARNARKLHVAILLLPRSRQLLSGVCLRLQTRVHARRVATSFIRRTRADSAIIYDKATMKITREFYGIK